MTADDWDNFEATTRPMSLWRNYHNKSLGADQLEIFREFYNSDNKQYPKKLLKRYPNQLEIRVTIIPAGPRRPEERRSDLFVIDHQLILESEPSARQYLDNYCTQDVVRPGLPRPLRDCSLLTRSGVIAHWAKPPKSAIYFE